MSNKSYYSVKDVATPLGAFVVLKIIFFDLGVSLGDAITDFLQGLYLLVDIETWEARIQYFTLNTLKEVRI